jgi:hypothetical protein
VLNQDDDNGALAIIVALFATAIFILGAMVVEGGVYQESHRTAQNTADAAALAAAAVLAEDGSRSRAVNIAAEYGVKNNYPPGRTEANYFAGCTAKVPSGWQRSARTSCVSFQPDATQPGRWSAVQVVTPPVESTGLFGLVVAPIRALAWGSIAPGVITHPPVLFGGDPSCSDTVRWNRIDAEGDIHSNGNLRGSSGSVTGDGTYRTTAATGSTAWDPSADNPTNVAADEDTLRSFPKSYSIEDFRPGGVWASDSNFHQPTTPGDTIDRNWLIDNDFLDSSRNLDEGIYYTTGDIDMNVQFRTTGDGATFVSDGGTITFRGNNRTRTMSPYADDLLAFSTASGCSTDGLAITGNSSSPLTFDGVIYTPTSRVRITSRATITGGASTGSSIEAATVQHSGSGLLTLHNLLDSTPGQPILHLSK